MCGDKLNSSHSTPWRYHHFIMATKPQEDYVLKFFYPVLIFLVNTYKYLELTLFKLLRAKVTSIVTDVFTTGDIIFNGTRPWDVRVTNPDLLVRLACDSTLGMGEAYMDGWWECDALDEFSYRIFSREMYRDYSHRMNRLVNYLLLRVFNLQTRARAFEVGEKHYDIGNDIFEAFLDPTMNYSCGYWKTATNLNQAQLDKMKLIGDKLKLSPGMRVLDIGCGWGGLCKYLAETYKVQVVGCTISVEGAKVARSRCSGLPVDIRLADYRSLDEKFDRIVSVGMFEHVGDLNYREFFQVCRTNLEENGILLLHTIGVSHTRVPLTEPWFHTYIFPNGILPYYKSIPNNIEDLFIIEDWHNFGHDYSRTLNAWYDNFVANWPKIAYKGERFFKMWTYYLKMSAGAFRSRKYQLWQVVLTKNGLEGGYESVR